MLGALLALVMNAACQSKSGEETDWGSGFDGDNVYGTPLPSRPAGGLSFLSPEVRKDVYPPVYFGFDSSLVSGAEMEKVRGMAGAIRSNGSTLIIAGFTDERGTEEYNRGLGERRALAVRDALVGEGVNPGNLHTVSFGEDMPADPGSNESAWARNRRAEFGVVP